jgi:DNA-binding NtrC family response regulator
VVDDDPVCVESLKIILETQNINVSTAMNIDSLRDVDLSKFHCIMLDIWLSDSYGEESLEIISKKNYKGIIVLISGMEKEEINLVSTKGLRAGLHMANYLRKPIRKSEVVELLSNSLISYEEKIVQFNTSEARL